MNQSKFKPYMVEKEIDEYAFPFYLGDEVGESWYLNLNRLSPEMQFMKRMVSPGDLIYDVGAHHGFTTLFLAHWAGPTGKVVGFEASPHNAVILNRNIRINHQTNVKVESQAVGARSGKIFISNFFNTDINAENTGIREVTMTSLDEYSQGNMPAIIKIDVEGYEIEVLKGAREVLTFLPKLAIEVHVPQMKQFDCVPVDLFRYIDRSAYSFWLQRNGKEDPVPYHDEMIQGEAQVHLYAVPKRQANA
jgi:FkbM family methyltransferase